MRLALLPGRVCPNQQRNPECNSGRIPGSLAGRTTGPATACPAAITRPLALTLALALTFAVALTPAPTFALTLPDTRAAVHTRTAIHARATVRTRAAIPLLTSFLTRGPFLIALRRTAIARAAAVRAALRQHGACGHQRRSHQCCESNCLHVVVVVVVATKRPTAEPFTIIDPGHMNRDHNNRLQFCYIRGQGSTSPIRQA